MKFKRYIVIALLIILISCSEEVKITDFTYPQIFTGETKKSWVMRSFQVLRKGKGTISVPPDALFDECIADDVYTFYFNSERSYIIDEGGSKCNPTDSDVVVNSNWSFVNTTASLTIVMPIFSGSPLPFIVSEIDETRMVLDLYLDDNSAYRLNFRTTSGD